jgi:hypothetical protein
MLFPASIPVIMAGSPQRRNWSLGSAHCDKFSSPLTLFSSFRSRFTWHTKRLTESGCLICNRMAIHSKPTVVRLRSNAASIDLRPSPFRRSASSAVPVGSPRCGAHCRIRRSASFCGFGKPLWILQVDSLQGLQQQRRFQPIFHYLRQGRNAQNLHAPPMLLRCPS